MADDLTRHANAHDASHFSMIPDEVVRATSIEHVAALMKRTSGGLTFRSGGTSLSGQGQTDKLLVDVRRHFRGVEVHDNGSLITCQPGATLRYANAVLHPYQRKLGPDPASEGAATIGGVVANNSSGMSCGTEFNSYATIEGLTLVLPSGSVIDTRRTDADAALYRVEPSISRGLAALRAKILSNASMVSRIRQQFSMKNTMGYGLNSFLDFDTPAKILEHLMIGSEGTLGFIGSATFRTVEKKRFVSTALLIFPSTHAAMSSLEALRATGASAIEFMDAESLRVGNSLRGVPELIRRLRVHRHAALLVEHESGTEEELENAARSLREVLADLPVEQSIDSTSDAATRASLWNFRKGLYTSVAGARPGGSTALLEDVAVPVTNLAHTCDDLTALFEGYGYRNSVIYGHAKDGNIHFMLTDTFSRPEALDRYERFTEDMVDLVLDRQGTLKAEHGTGRVMAPFVRRQYGDDLYDVMVELKKLIDPAMILNKDTIISDDDRIHMKNFKEFPEIDPAFDRCTECGYCEPVCPSEDLTLTPRQRIAVMRRTGSHQDASYDYHVLHTCAADSMCAVACPLGIDTGALVKQERGERLGKTADRVWDTAADHWATATRGAATALTLASASPAPIQSAAKNTNAILRNVISTDTLPQWDPSLPSGGKRRRRPNRQAPSHYLYLPSCVNAMFGAEKGDGVQEALLALADAAGVEMTIPAEIDSICCGTVWSSKGLKSGWQTMVNKVESVMADHSDSVVVVSDASACTQGFQKLVAAMQGVNVDVIDAVTFVRAQILPHLTIEDKIDSIVLHPTCSSTQLGIDNDLLAVAHAASHDVTVPAAWTCCGFAGDRGMLHPELTASATTRESAEAAAAGASAYASCNRTCEIGMSRATGTDYHHIIEVVRDLALTN